MKRTKSLAVLLLCLAAFTFLPVRAWAAGSIDLKEDASLTITERYGEAALSGVTFDLYLVSTVDTTGELTPVDAFWKFVSGLDIRGENDEAWQSMAETLEREILLGGLGNLAPAASAVTDDEGVARFPSNGSRLTLGLYLVLGTRMEQDGYVYSTAPFFVLLPTQDAQTNTWNYDVQAKAKPDQNPVRDDFKVIKLWEDDCHKDRRPQSITVQLLCDGEAYGDPVALPYEGEWSYTWRDLDVNHYWTVTEPQVEGYEEPNIRQEGNTFIITNVCDKPGAPANPNLPQTGQLWWPVPVLIAAGLLLVVIGLIRRRGEP